MNKQDSLKSVWDVARLYINVKLGTGETQSPKVIKSLEDKGWRFQSDIVRAPSYISEVTQITNPEGEAVTKSNMEYLNAVSDALNETSTAPNLKHS